jgi:cytochrome c
MDSIEVTKVSTAVLVAGIAYFLTGMIGADIVHPERPAKPAIEIKGAEPETAAAPQEETLAPIAPLLAKADPAEGESTFKKLCTACHTSNEGGKAGIGPNSYGVVGGPHAHMEGFNYTAGLKAKEGPWTYDELNEWLKQPSAYVKGTRMTFAGIKNDQLRADVIDYLHVLSHSPEPLPAASPAPAAAPASAPGAAPPPAPANTAAPAPAAPANSAQPAPAAPPPAK